ncbi:MAG: twin-arginine translocase subunit TatC, partial [Candidatus Edwardsbacteria bacterium]|nr:twin-arginine translocase subunit TatC [Candidatus Edwardsbacteria bacterium]
SLVGSLMLFLSGAAFCYYLIVPPAVSFLLGIAGPDLKPLLSVGKYLSFIIWLLVSFGLSFQLPVVIAILAKLGIVKARTLRRQWRVAYFAAFLIAALGPTVDMFSQVAMAVPLIALYEISILIAKLVEPKASKEPKVPKVLDTYPAG